MSGDDRDKLTPKTPPPAVAEQLARRADSQFGEEELTPVFGDPVTQINKRAKDAAGAARGAFAAIREVRKEMNDAHRAMNDRSDKLADKIDAVQGEVSDLKGKMGEVSGKMTMLIDAHKEQARIHGDVLVMRAKAETDLETHERKTELEVFAAREKTDLEITAAREKTDLEISAAREKTELEERKEAAKHRRAKVMWALGILGAVIAAFLAGKFG